MKRDFAALERRRIEAVRLVVEEGLSQGEAARGVKAAQQSVSGWVRRYREGGKAGRAGRKPLLTEAQLRQLETFLPCRLHPFSKGQSGQLQVFCPSANPPRRSASAGSPLRPRLAGMC